jgi:hypothetical protein
MKPKILIILPRGETFRNFIYTDIINDLLKFYHITLLAVKPNEEIWKMLQKNCDELIELKKEKFSYPYKFFFEIFDLAHNRYMWSEAAKVRWEMRDVESNTFRKKIIRIFKKTIAILLANQYMLKKLESVEKWLVKMEPQVIEYYIFIKKNNFKLVFNTSHSHANISLPVVYAASRANIKTCTFLYSWDNLTSQGRVVPRYNYYFAWNSKIKNDFHKIYPHIPKNQVLVTGTPQFINHFNSTKILNKEQLYQKLGISLDTRYFLYSSGMSHHMPFEPYVVERIADIIYQIDPKLKLVVRTYAKDKANVFQELKNRRKDIIIPDVNWEIKYQTPLVNDQEFFIALLQNCLAGINVASTVSLELCMLNKPAINVGYNPPEKNIFPYNYTRFYNFDHYKPIVESGAVQIAKNEKDMKILLEKTITNPNQFQKERKNLINVFFENNLKENVKINFINVISKIVNEP